MAVPGAEAFIENRTFDEIEVGETASIVRTLTRADIELFAVMSGDVNPAHVDEEFATADVFHEIIAHGMWGGALISTVLGTELPGPGTIYLGQTLRFRRPVGVGDEITVTLTASDKDDERHRVRFDCACHNQRGELVISGEAEVIAPTEKIRRPRVELPEVHLHERGLLYRNLIARAAGLEPIRVAVVHPVDADSLLAATSAAQAGLITPTLVGPRARIGAAAVDAEIDIADVPVISTEHSEAAAETALALARSGRVDAVMRGSLASEELIGVLERGLSTDRHLSHVFVMDVPAYPRPLIITDAGLNVEPDLETKRDIVQNAIELARAMGVETPRVAILSAVETVNPRVRSALDAAALTKMADRGQIVGAVVDGPLGFDTAVSPVAARELEVASPVAGSADILVVPDLEAGTMLTKQLEHLADSQGSGVVLGGRVPILVADVAAAPPARMISCALAQLLVRRGTREKPRR